MTEKLITRFDGKPRLRSYAKAMVEDSSWPLFLEEMKTMYFLEWSVAESREIRENIYQEYQAFQRMVGSLKALAFAFDRHRETEHNG